VLRSKMEALQADKRTGLILNAPTDGAPKNALHESVRHFFVDLYTKGRNSQRRQKGGGAHKQQGAGSFSGRAVVSRCASISVMLFPLIYCSVTCSTQAQ
ncbi:MAG: hypothetical protein WAX11_10370, partial [Gemmiger qucibialis]